MDSESENEFLNVTRVLVELNWISCMETFRTFSKRT